MLQTKAGGFIQAAIKNKSNEVGTDRRNLSAYSNNATWRVFAITANDSDRMVLKYKCRGYILTDGS